MNYVPFILANLVFFIAWLYFMRLMASLGWSEFVKQHGTKMVKAGRSYPCHSLVFDPDHPRGRSTASLTPTSEGVLFSCGIFFFRPYHPPFLVPWDLVMILESIDGGKSLLVKSDAGTFIAGVDGDFFQSPHVLCRDLKILES